MKCSIWVKADNRKVIQVIDQRFLPHRCSIKNLTTIEDVIFAIKEMVIRGAPLIGITAAFGVYLALLKGPRIMPIRFLHQIFRRLQDTRPTAVNLEWSLAQMKRSLRGSSDKNILVQKAFQAAVRLMEEDVRQCELIGLHGLTVLKQLSKRKQRKPLNILTHCNAGRLACVALGTATAPIYLAHKNGIKIHVLVSETRPRNQGAALTAWELTDEKIQHTIIADNAAGHLMQQRQIDLVLVGADRVASNGDTANKIGTYMKALAAKANHVPFYVAMPTNTVDWNLHTGSGIPIEERRQEEVTTIIGRYKNSIIPVLLAPQSSPALNYGFDVTPNHLITGFITNTGVVKNLSQLRKNKNAG